MNGRFALRLAPLPLMAALAAGGIVAQGFLAGLAMFGSAAGFGPHKMLGGLLAVPILGLLVATRMTGSAACRRPADLLALLYVLQPALVVAGTAYGVSWIAALHLANALLMLLVAAELLRRTARMA